MKNFIAGVLMLGAMIAGAVFLIGQSGEPGIIDGKQIAAMEDPAPLLAVISNHELEWRLRSLATQRLISLLDGSPAKIAEVESALALARDEASTTRHQSDFRHPISMINHGNLVELEQQLRSGAASIIDVDTDTAGGFRKPSEFAELAEGTVVDALVDLKTSDGITEYSHHAPTLEYSASPFYGLTKAEMHDLMKRADKVALVIRKQSIVARYWGDCTGVGYQEIADLYVVSLRDKRVVGAERITGPSPPAGFTTTQFGSCSVSGGAADLQDFISIAGR